MNTITQTEIGNLPHPPQEWLDEIHTEIQNEIYMINYNYNEWIDDMPYSYLHSIVKEHVNPNLPLSRHKKVIIDIIENYLNKHQDNQCIYRKGTSQQFLANWDDCPANDFRNFKGKKSLRQYYKDDMLKLYENDGAEEKRINYEMKLFGRYVCGGGHGTPELKTDIEIEKFNQFGNNFEEDKMNYDSITLF